MLTIMKQDLINLWKNKPIMMYLLIYPILLIPITGFVFNSIFTGGILNSYDYYGVTMMIYLSMATVIILPETLFGSSVKYANYRIIYSPIPRYQIYMSKLFVSILLSYLILACYTIVFNATKIDFEKPFEGESTIAIIGIVASFCAILVVTLFTVAKKVVEQTK